MRLIRRRAEPLGVILAGGSGRRLGGSKAIVELAARPLISYPYAAMVRSDLTEIAVIVKPGTELPGLAGASVWIEPETRCHPLVGIVAALSLAGDRPVLVCAVDLPFVSPQTISAIADADPAGAPAVLGSCRGAVAPLLACYQPSAVKLLGDAAREGQLSVQEAVAAIGPRRLEIEDPDELFTVKTPDDLLQAAGMLDRRRRITRR